MGRLLTPLLWWHTLENQTSLKYFELEWEWCYFYGGFLHHETEIPLDDNILVNDANDVCPDRLKFTMLLKYLLRDFFYW